MVKVSFVHGLDSISLSDRTVRYPSWFLRAVCRGVQRNRKSPAPQNKTGLRCTMVVVVGQKTPALVSRVSRGDDDGSEDAPSREH